VVYKSRDVALKAQEKAALQFQLSELLDANEPMAMLATLRRVAERMAFRAAKLNDLEAAAKWQALVDLIPE
jgi:hypothetical protein